MSPWKRNIEHSNDNFCSPGAQGYDRWELLVRSLELEKKKNSDARPFGMYEKIAME